MLGKRIKELRKKKGITQKELASYLGISDRAVGYYESGQRTPPPDILQKIADFFNVSTDYLLGRTNIYNPADEITEAVFDDPELLEFWRELKEREDLKLLFKQTKKLSPKDIKQIIRIIKAIEDEEDKGE
ncbi:XRE family transcriptional regulator [Thermoanaerobacter brockii subsp. lactiethylicus]|uniref:Transcriptional regulator, XRE family n=2 Tax=Thermoanaerobacter TaxID=1754 RepID=B0KAT4_THEP3|nr:MULTISPECIES: helix-turn-helix transcriptional regulator [Thermoanaerobacter]ABY93705.1 transcriptional regulator, XRE family [Thermoanaerobacter pseudethanolicus ATCC 33223]ADV78665.1 helix-turn-helix domain protein [Thermoanaerobacter brockii subsp. finnii Ako-1]HBW60410.1 XRE family transcriptional regulator [Thermoanaerobacter sp.]